MKVNVPNIMFIDNNDINKKKFRASACLLKNHQFLASSLFLPMLFCTPLYRSWGSQSKLCGQSKCIKRLIQEMHCHIFERRELAVITGKFTFDRRNQFLWSELPDYSKRPMITIIHIILSKPTSILLNSNMTPKDKFSISNFTNS